MPVASSSLPNTNTASVGGDKALPYRGARFPTKYRRNFPRSKAGCLTCRARRKKCDEFKPSCTLCSKTGKECTWPAIEGNKQPSENGSSSGLQETSKETFYSTNPPRREMPRLSESEGVSLAIAAVSKGQQFAKGSSPLRASLSWGNVSNLSDVSRSLYEQYLTVTAEILVRGNTLDGNPFINYVLPLAMSDGLIMECVLAIGGSHMSVLDPKARQLEVMARGHYARVLEGLQKILANETVSSFGETDGEKIQYVLLILLLLCIFEGVQGDVHGAVYHHLRASRQYVVSLKETAQNPSSDKLLHIRGFLLEMYAFLALKLAITPRGALEHHTVQLDPFLESLDFLSQYKSRGFLLGFGHNLFALIPEISKIVEDRRLEESTNTKSKTLYESYEHLVARLDAFDAFADVLEGEGLCPAFEQGSAAAIYKSALIIYLQSAFHEDILNNHDLVAEIEKRINKTLPLCWAIYSSTSPLRRMMLWPAAIIASCCRTPIHMEAFRYGLNFNPRAPGGVKATATAVELLWADADPRAYGPRGLSMVMKKHGLSFSMC